MAKKRLTQQEATEQLKQAERLVLILSEQAEPTTSWNGTLLKDALREANYALSRAITYIKELPE